MLVLLAVISIIFLNSVSAVDIVDSDETILEENNLDISNNIKVDGPIVGASQEDEHVLGADYNPKLSISDNDNGDGPINLETGDKATLNIRAYDVNFNYYGSVKVSIYNGTEKLASDISLSSYYYNNDDYRATYSLTFYKAGTYVISAVLPEYNNPYSYSYAGAVSNNITYVVTGEDIDPDSLPKDYYLRIYGEDAPDNTTFVYDGIATFNIYNKLYNNLGLSGSAVKNSLYQGGSGSYNPVTYYVNGQQVSDSSGYTVAVWVNGTAEAGSFYSYKNYLSWRPSFTGVYEIYAVYSATQALGTLKSDTITLYVGVEPPAEGKATTLTLTTTNSDYKVNDSITITPSVIDEDGDTVSEGNVTYKYSDGTLIDTLDVTTPLTLPTSLAAGNHTIIATYNANDNYKASDDASIIINISKYDVDLSISVDSPTYPTNATATVTSNVAGSYVVRVNGKNYNVVIEEGSNNNTVTIDRLAASDEDYTASVNFTGNSKYNNAYDTANFKVNRGTIELSIEISEIRYPNNVTGSVKANVAGTYTVKIGDNEIPVIVDESGVKTFDAGKFDVKNNYEASVSISQTANYTAAFSSTTFNVTNDATSLTISASDNEIDYGTPITLKHEITSGVTGKIKFSYINNTVIGEVNVGDALENIVLPVGIYQIYANYTSDNANYKDTTSTPITVSVNALSNNIDLTIASVDYPNLVNIELTADVDGDYNVYLNTSSTPITVTVNGKQGNKTIQLAAGSYKANVSWSGENYADAFDEKEFNVNKATNGITLNIDSVELPDKVEIKVTADIDGVYTVELDDASNTKVDVTVVGKSGSESITLPAGSYTATLNYNNENYTSVLLTKSFTVTDISSSEIVQIRDSANPTQSVFNYDENNNIIIEYYVNRPEGTYLTEELTIYCNDVYFTSFSISYGSSGSLAIGSWQNIGGSITFNESGTYVFKATYKTVGFGSTSYDETSNTLTYNVVVTPKENYTTELELSDYETGKSDIVHSEIKDLNILISLFSSELGNSIGDYANGSSVNLYQSGHLLGSLTLNEDGQALATISPITSEGWYNFTVEFKGNSKGLLASENATINFYLSNEAPQEKENYTTALKASDNATGKSGIVNSTVGENLNILISLFSSELGNSIGDYANGSSVNLYQSGHLLGSLTLNEDGQALATISPITSEGWYNFTVEFKGNSKGLLASENATISYYVSNKTGDDKNESKADATLTIEVTSASVSVGDIVTFTYTLTNGAGGTISFMDGNTVIKTIDVGDAFTINNLTQGLHFIEARYNGDDNYNAATSNMIVIDVKALTNKLSINATDVEYPQKVTITVTADVDGDYKVTINGNETTITVNNGTGFINILLPVGEYVATVAYDGDGTYASNSARTSFKVSLKNPNFTAASNPSEIKLGESVNLTSSADTDGNVTYTLPDGSVINAKVGENVLFTPDTYGDIKIVATFDGGDEYESQDVTITIKVNDNRIETQMNISAPNEVVIGDDITVKVELPKDATGNVTYTIDGESVTLPVGEDLTVTADKSGNKVITATYNGDKNYSPVTASKTVKVNKKDLTLEATISPSEVAVGDNVTIKSNVNRDATGTITYNVNGKPVTLAVGQNYTFDSSVVGVNNVTITYNGDDNYNSKSITKTFVVNDIPQEDIVVKAPDVDKYYKGSERFNVEVTDSEGNVIANQLVQITINGVSYNRTTDENGTTSIPLGLNSGKYNVTVKANDTTVISLVNIKSTVNGNDVTKMFRNGTQYYATFVDSTGNLLKNTTVSFNINGVYYNRTTDDKGVAQLNINLHQGEYVLTAINPENGEMATNIVNVVPSLVENNDVVKYYRNGTQYSVKVLDDNGNALANATVTFNINGIFYKRTTDLNGIATLNLNLQPGNYIITAEYNDCKVSNNIEIKPVLSANDLTKKYASLDQFVAKLVDGQGIPLAGEKITFNINGVLYDRTTDADGLAKLNINLRSGDYIITSSYNGANIANTIKVND